MPPKLDKAKNKGKTKGKTPKKKKVRLSEEDRVRQQEQRAAVEEERRRLREELVHTFLRHKLTREQALAKSNLAKITEKWRKIMRETKAEALHQELTELQLDFNRKLSLKELRIATLLDDIDTLQDRYAEIAAEHQARMQAALLLHSKKLQGLQASFRKDMDQMIESRRKHAHEEIISYGKDMNKEKANLESQAQQWETENDKTQSAFQSRHDELVNHWLEEQQSTRLVLERHMEHMWFLIQETLIEYQDTQEKRTTLFRDLKAQDLARTKALADDEAKLKELTAQSNAIKAQLALANSGKSSSIEALIQERNALLKQQQTLRSQLRKQQEHYSAQLRLIVNTAADTRQKLETWKSKAQNLCKLMEHCKTLQTRDDVAESQAHYSPNPKGGLDNSYDALEPLWRLLNKAYVEKVALQKHLAGFLPVPTSPVDLSICITVEPCQALSKPPTKTPIPILANLTPRTKPIVVRAQSAGSTDASLSL